MSPQCGNIKQWPCPPRATIRNAAPHFQHFNGFPLFLVKHEAPWKGLDSLAALSLLRSPAHSGACSSAPSRLCHGELSALHADKIIPCLGHILLSLPHSHLHPSGYRSTVTSTGNISSPLFSVNALITCQWTPDASLGVFYIMFDSSINLLSPPLGDKLQENRDLLVSLTIECGAHRGPGTQ